MGLGTVWGARGEGQNNVMRLKMNSSHLCLSNCLFPERTQRPDTIRQEGGWMWARFSTHSSLLYLKRETWPADSLCMMNKTTMIWMMESCKLPFSTKNTRCTTVAAARASHPHRVIYLLSISQCLSLSRHVRAERWLFLADSPTGELWMRWKAHNDI